MDELVARTGNGDFEISLSWLAEHPQGTGAEATRGLLRVNLGGREVWYGEDKSTGFEWTWIELLEFLAEYWLYLSIEDGAPLGVALDTVPRMLEAAEAKIRRGQQAGSDPEEELEAYRVSHDLAEALQGAVGPPLWIMRDGESGWVASDAATTRAPFNELLDVLIKVGDFIATRLAPLADERAIKAVRAWSRRESHGRLRIIEAATGFRPELVVDVEKSFYSQNERDWAVPNSDELLAAARMVGPQPATTLVPILQKVREVGKTETSTLDRVSESALKVFADVLHKKPYEQGYKLAAWLRSQPQVTSDSGRVDPGRILESWGVSVTDVCSGLGSIDAIGCWGPRHGPAVLVNEARHAGNSGRRRATLAHEVCHLLVDRSGSLPLVEVLGGRTAKRAEQRARAFAAELLAPRQLAGLEFAEAQGDLAEVMQGLCFRFGVTTELLAWQVRNSGAALTPKSRKYLADLAKDAWHATTERGDAVRQLAIR